MRASRTTAGMKARNIRHKHPRRGILPGRSARQRRQKKSSQQENHEPRRRYSCDCTGIAPPFLSFLRRFYGRGAGNPTRALLKIAYRGAQEGPVRDCGAGLGKHQGDGRRAQDGRAAACVRCSVGVAACGHRRREARKRRTGAHHHRRHANKRHQWRERATRILEKQSNFLFYAALLSKRLRTRSAEKQVRTRATDTIPPLSSISIMGVANTGRGPSVNSAWPEFSGGLPHDLTLYFLHYS